jgi:Tol biopolymer transport system component
VLFELLTGRQTFGGDTLTDIMGSIVKADPDWRAMPADAARVLPLLRRCLQKEVNKRLQHIGDARIELEEVITAPLEPQRRPAGSTRSFWTMGGWIAAAAALAIAAWGLARNPSAPEAAPEGIQRLTITVPKDRPVTLTRHALVGVGRPSIAISPDGGTLVYVADIGETTQLHSRPIDSFESKAIPKTEGARDPFFSPDGRSLGFFTEDKLKTVLIDGGDATTLADARLAWGGSWSPDGTIVFSDSEGYSFMRVSAKGGPAERIASPFFSRSPSVLPDGKSALLTVQAPGGGGGGGTQLVVISLDTGKQKVLLEGADGARYVETGHVLFMRGSSLMAAPFDPATHTIGSPQLVLEGVRSEQNGAGQYAVSSRGTLAYIPGGAVTAGALGWTDPKGSFEPLRLPVRIYGTFKISHDGRRLAFGMLDPLSDIYIYDFDRQTSERLTTTGNNWWPAWTLDDKRVAFSSSRSGDSGIFSKSPDGVGAEEELVRGSSPQPDAWSPDGKYLAFTSVETMNISILPFSADRKPQPFLDSQFAEWGASFSPDGRYIAYTSDKDGKYQIYVQPFPDKGKIWQVSTEGGEEPLWSRDGRQLFYRYGQKWMVSEVQLTPEFSARPPRVLFEGPYINVGGLSYDVSLDGKRFLVIKPNDLTETTTEVSVVLNWFEELKRRVPSATAPAK